MQKTKIEWVKNPDGSQGYSWNPIKGLCPVECWYCYGKRYYERFWHLHGYPIKFYENEIEQVYKLKKPSGIFLCSVFEIFHDITKTDFKDSGGQYTNWRDCIFDTIEDNPQHHFYILTKYPQNIDREMPENVWLGVTVTKGNDKGWERIFALKEAKARIKFISFEPLLGMLNTPMIINAVDFDWFIFGRLTGFGKKYDPDKRWIEPAVSYFRGYKKPVFLKDNLKLIWGDNLIQNSPE